MSVSQRTLRDGLAETPITSSASQQHCIKVVAKTWARDSHDLFDFEAQHLHSKEITVSRPQLCIRNGTDVQCLSQHEESPATADQLLRFTQRDGHFWIDKASGQNCRKLWLVVKELQTIGQRLSENDVMKLGRFKFRVRQMVTGSAEGAPAQAELRLDETTPPARVDLLNLDAHAATMCRICLTEGSTEDDPLIAPCSCKGSIEYVHLGCLRHWIKGRLNFSESSTSFFYRPLSCELCKTVYPAHVEVNTAAGPEKWPMVEVPTIKAPFIALENMVRDSQQHSARGLHVISLADNKLLKLGRGHESDVRIADVSISRCHATIRFHRGGFVLEDHNSKFGTLIALKKPRLLEVGSNISIQVGRSVLGLSLVPTTPAAGEAPDSVLGTLSAGPWQPGGGPTNAQEERALRLQLLTRNPTASMSEDGSAQPPSSGNPWGPC